MQKHANYLVSGALLFLLISCAYHYVFRLQFGAPIPAEYWIYEERILKQSLAQLRPSPKLIIASGSNSLFGIDSDSLALAIDLPVVNLAIHAGLPLDWILDSVREVAHPGDIVVLPLEWSYYTSDYTEPSKWFYEQVVAWNSDYFESLDVFRRVKFISAVAVEDVVETLWVQTQKREVLRTRPERRLRTPNELLSTYAKTARPTIRSYSYLNTSLSGDMLNTCGANHTTGLDDFRYVESTRPSFASLWRLKRWIDELADRGITVFVSFPVTAANKYTSAEEFRTIARNIEQLLETLGIQMIGKLSDHVYEQSSFLDTYYHLNCDGRSIRTAMIGNRILEALRKSSLRRVGTGGATNLRMLALPWLRFSDLRVPVP